MNNNKDYKKLYKKYKLKYLNLKKQVGGDYYLVIFRKEHYQHGSIVYKYSLLINDDTFSNNKKVLCPDDYNKKYNLINNIAYYHNHYEAENFTFLYDKQYSYYYYNLLDLINSENPEKVRIMSGFYNDIGREFNCDGKKYDEFKYVGSSNYNKVFTDEFLKSAEFKNYETNLRKMRLRLDKGDERGFFIGAKKGIINFALSLKNMKEMFDIQYLIIQPEQGAVEYYKKLGFFGVEYNDREKIMIANVSNLMETPEFQDVYKTCDVKIENLNDDYYHLLKYYDEKQDESQKIINSYNEKYTKFI